MIEGECEESQQSGCLKIAPWEGLAEPDTNSAHVNEMFILQISRRENFLRYNFSLDTHSDWPDREKKSIEVDTKRQQQKMRSSVQT